VKSFSALLRRELTSRWPALAASLVMGAFIACLPVLSPPGTVSPAELRSLASAGVILIWSAILALLLGASLFAREVGGGAFDFRIPASGLILWMARLSAALALLALCVGLVLLPSLLIGFDPGAFRTALAAPSMIPASAGPLFLLFFYAGALTFLLLLTNAVSLAVRSHAAWSMLDLVSVASLAGAIGISWKRLREIEAPLAVEILLCLVSAQLLATLLVASAAQIARGRGEADRAHRAHAILLFAGATLASAATLLFSSWYVQPTPADLAAGSTTVTPVGSHRVIATGPVVDRIHLYTRFLIDLRTGEWRRLRSVGNLRQLGGGHASADDRVVAWFEAESGTRPTRAKLVLHDSPDLASPARETAITADSLVSTWALAPDGRSVTFAYPGTTTEPVHIRLLRIDPAEDLALVPVGGCRNPQHLQYRDERTLLLGCFEIDPSRQENRLTWSWYELSIESQAVRASVAPSRRNGLGEPYPNPEPTAPLTLSVVSCAKKPCRLLARDRSGARLVWLPWEVLLLDERSGREVVLVPAAELARTAEVVTRLAIVQDARNRWFWFDAEAAELRPVFEETQYGRSRRVFGY
jgi:hypothetical protein